MVCISRQALTAGAFAVLAILVVGCTNSESPAPPATPPESAHDDHEHTPHAKAAADDRKLYLTPGGKYTEADILANGGVVAAEKFRGLKPAHDAKPKPGDVLCPISMTKASAKFSWVIGGKTYQFCCPPCVDEFVARAKEKPDEIEEPEFYRKE